MHPTNGFTLWSLDGSGGRSRQFHRHAVDPSMFESSTSIILADESWRQYVFPVVTAGVLIDILLGSPLANSALKPLRGAEADAGDEDDRAADTYDVTRSKERVDSDKIAKAAIERAENALELRRFLDERKTDWDKMEEMKKSLDEGMQDFDSDFQTREEKLAQELEKRRKN